MAQSQLKSPRFGNIPVLDSKQATLLFQDAMELLNRDNLQAPNFRDILRLFGRGISAKQELELAIGIFSYTGHGAKKPKNADRNVDLRDVLWDFEKRPTKRFKNNKLKRFVDQWSSKSSGDRGSVASFLEGLTDIQQSSVRIKESPTVSRSTR